MLLRNALWVSMVFVLTLLSPAFSVAASPLSVSISPNENVALNSNVNIQAVGGTAPYWITISNPGMVLYTPGKLDKNGRPNGLWNMTVIKPGQCNFTMRDATGATATATLTVTAQTAPPSPSQQLTAALSNPSPYINEATTLSVSGGIAP